MAATSKQRKAKLFRPHGMIRKKMPDDADLVDKLPERAPGACEDDEAADDARAARRDADAQHAAHMNQMERLERSAIALATLVRKLEGVVGAYALTDHTPGSDPANMFTTATAEGDGWHIKGRKRFITFACALNPECSSLIATGRSTMSWTPRYTAPMPPSPIFSASR